MDVGSYAKIKLVLLLIFSVWCATFMSAGIVVPHWTVEWFLKPVENGWEHLLVVACTC